MGTVKTLKGKLTVILIVFMMLFSNLGFTMSAIATSEAFEVIDNGFFRKDEIKFNAYFEDEDGNQITELTGNVNEDLKLVLEVFPQVEGFLKEGSIKAVSSDGSDINFEFTNVTQNLLETSKFEDTIEIEEESAEDSKDNVDEELEEEPAVEEGNVEESKTEENTGTSDAIQNILDKVTSGEAKDNILSTVVQSSLSANAEVLPKDDKVDEVEEVVEEKTEEELYEEELNKAIFDIAIEDKNMISINNIIEDTKIVANISYVQNEELNLEDLIKSIKLQLSGKFINKKLKEVKIGLEEEVTVGWEYSKDFSLKSEFTKFSPFNIGNVSGTIVQNDITIERNIEDEKYLPVKSSIIEVSVPKINDKYPKHVNVIANKLLATVGQDVGETEFSDNNWSYDQENGKIEIKVTNKKDSKAINTFGNDEYVIIYRYEDFVDGENYTLSNNVKARLEEYSANGNNTTTKEVSEDNEVVVVRNDLLSYSIGTSEEEIAKGKIYANYNSEYPIYETEYKTQVKVNILTSDIFESLRIDATKEIYKNKNQEEFEASGIAYRKIKFNYSQLKEILSAGGEILVKNTNDEVLYVLNNDVINSENDCVANLNGAEGIFVEVNNVKRNGQIDFEITKSIAGCNLTKDVFSRITDIESKISAIVRYTGIEEDIVLQEIGVNKGFKESKTKINLEMSKTKLATTKTNGNVEFKIELNNNTFDSDLYVNPMFEIAFPSEVRDINLQSINILHGGELQVDEFGKYRHEDGTMRIKAYLKGTQTRFVISELTNGTNIIINADIIVDEYTASRKDKVKLYCYNAGATNYASYIDWSFERPYAEEYRSASVGYATDTFEFQGLSGMIAVNAIKGFDGENSIIQSIRQGELIKNYPREKELTYATMELAVINNTGVACENVVLLGRIPFTGNKDVVSGKDLGTTVDSEMTRGIQEDLDNGNNNRAIIYYSSNPNATKDLNDKNNGWTTDIASSILIKSYMIVVDGIVKNGESLRYDYIFEIPKNLGYEQKMIGSFAAYYDETRELSTRSNVTVADNVGIATEVGAKLEAEMSVNIGEDEEIGEARYLKYKIKVSNTGSVDLENVKVNLKDMSYLNMCQRTNNMHGGDDGYEVIGTLVNPESIDLLKVGETKELVIVTKTKERPETLEDYYAKDHRIQQDDEGYYKIVNDTKEYITEIPEEITIEPYAVVTVGDSVKTYKTNKVVNKLVDSNFDIETSIYGGNRTFVTGEVIEYLLYVVNISGEDQKNITVENIMPKEFKYIDQYEMYDQYETEYDDENHILSFKIDEIKDNGTAKVVLRYDISQMKNVSKTQVVNQYKLITKKFEEKGTAIKTDVIGAELEITQETSLINNQAKETEEFDITYKINNIGEGNSEKIRLKVELPKDIKILKMSSIGDSEVITAETENIVDAEISGIGAKSNAILNLRVRSVALAEGELKREVVVKSSATESNIGEIEIKDLNLTFVDDPDRELTTEEKDQIMEENTVKNPEANDDYLNDTPANNDSGNNNNNNSGNNNQNSESNGNSSNNQNNTNNQNSGNNSNNSNGNTVNNQTEQKDEQIKTYRIAGEVWKDKNKDGVKDDSEERMKQVKVSLYQGNSQIKTSRTDTLGRYSFNDVKVGEYIVVFEYNSGLYVATTYKKAGVEENRNSDVIESEEGKAVTNAISLSNADQQVDLGLQVRNDFDLAVEKYISKAIVNTNGKETVNEYDNVSLEKLEIKSKELTNTTIKLEYKIVVTNIGNVNGTVKVVKDYLPKTLRFDQSENPDWYINSEGVLCNDTLDKNEIKPGQTKELTLVLNKVMTADNTGTIVNKVELSGLTNEDSLEEKPDNNVATQEMIITVSTGRTVQVVLLVACIAGFAVLFNFVNIKALLTGKKIYR